MFGAINESNSQILLPLAHDYLERETRNRDEPDPDLKLRAQPATPGHDPSLTILK